MRCLNCGWDNPQGTLCCLKCGQPIIQSSPAVAPSEVNVAATPEISGRATRVVSDATAAEPQPKPTVLNVQVEESRHRATMLHNPMPETPATGGEAAPATPGVCPKCGYPVVAGSRACPNCGAEIAEVSTPTQASTPPPSPSPIPAPTSGRSTIRLSVADLPSLEPQPEPKRHCYLTPIGTDDQVLSDQKITYEGDEVILNRNNTDPANRSITSHEQAALKFADGQWSIENRSDFKTTFLQVERPLGLQPRDIIVLGNRRFLFEVDEQ